MKLLSIEYYIIAIIIAILVNLLMYAVFKGGQPVIVGETENTCTNCGHNFKERPAHCPKCAVKLFYDQ